jgi:hypothetical protein
MIQQSSVISQHSCCVKIIDLVSIDLNVIMRLVILCITLACTAAYAPLVVSRRHTLQALVAGLVAGSPAVAANALEACNPKANNCVFVTWAPPPATSRSSAIKDLRSVIEAYPQEGQAVSSFMTWLSTSASFLRDLNLL